MSASQFFKSKQGAIDSVMKNRNPGKRVDISLLPTCPWCNQPMLVGQAHCHRSERSNKFCIITNPGADDLPDGQDPPDLKPFISDRTTPHYTSGINQGPLPKVEVPETNDPDVAFGKKFTVQGGLREAADLFEERNKQYGSAYKEFGGILKELSYDLNLETEMDFARYALFMQIAGKLHRYSKNFHSDGHADSLDDISVYAQMLQDIDKNGL